MGKLIQNRGRYAPLAKLAMMIHDLLIATRPALYRKPAVFLCMLALFAVLPAHAAPPKSTSPTKAATSSPDAPTPTAITIEPSRYVSPKNLQAYVQSINLTFSMKTRSTDPFGQLQDPDAKPRIKPSVVKPTRKTTLPTQITPFAEIVRRIRVSTVMPADRSFLIGTRSFKQGDRFPMNFRGRRISVEISAVNSREIAFRNLDNDETAALKLNVLPVGMTPGNGKITAPGMVRESADSPLEIEPIGSSDDNSLN